MAKVSFNIEAEFKTYLQDLPFGDLIDLWNEYCDENEYQDDRIFYSVSDFAETYLPDADAFGRMIFFGELRGWNDYVALDGYGNFISQTSVDDSKIDVDDLAQWMIDSDHHLFEAWMDDNYPEDDEE